MPTESVTDAAGAAGPGVAEPATAPQEKRVLGLDVARSIAILGIFLAHYGPSSVDAGHGWAIKVKEFTDGRALPVFVVLAGVGFVFLTRRAVHPIREVLGRSILLFVVGLMFEATTTIGMILQCYAVYFLVALAFRKVSNKALLWSAAAVVVVGWLVNTFGLQHLPLTLTYLDFGLGRTWGSLGMVLHPKELFTSLFLNGFYPLFPTFGFFLVGMWLGRQDLNNLKLRNRIGAVGLAMCVVATGFGWATQAHRAELGIYNGPLADTNAMGAAAGLGGAGLDTAGLDTAGLDTAGLDTAGLDTAGLDTAGLGDATAGTQSGATTTVPGAAPTPVTTAPSATPVTTAPATSGSESPTGETSMLFPSQRQNTLYRAAWSATDQSGHSNMPTWMIAVTGFALVVIVLCLYFAERFTAIATVLAHGGQLALTAYVGHIALKRWVLEGWPYNYSPAASVGLIFAAFVGFVLFSTLWRRKFAQGPLEMLLRMVGSVAATGKFK